MTDPPRTILPSAGTAGPDGLLATKLYLPRRRPGFITRPRLTERLDESLTRELVLVCAPAGFGKTALLFRAVLSEHLGEGWRRPA